MRARIQPPVRTERIAQAGRIASLSLSDRKGKPIEVTLDSGASYVIDTGVALEAKLEIGADLNLDEIAALIDADDLVAAKQVASNQLAWRARSVHELRSVLKQRGFREHIVEEVIARFTELGYLDDADFARRWIANRSELAPRGVGLLKRELRQKGIGPEIVDDALENADLDDVESALALATHRLERLRDLDPATQRRRLAQFLERRGFTYETIRKIDRILFGNVRRET